MFYFFDVADIRSVGDVQRHIMQLMQDGGVRSFPLTDDNPNKVAYDAWVAEGNTATEYSPE